MDYNKIINIGTPVNEADAVNKQYVDRVIQNEYEIIPYALGRYIVIPHNGSKTYFSVRAKKNIDLDRGLLVEIKNNIADSDENEFNHRPTDIKIIRNVLLLPPNLDKNLGLMQLNPELQITHQQGLLETWCLLFSAKLGSGPHLTLQITNTGRNILATLEPGTFKYVITDDFNNSRNGISFDIDTTQLNHIVFKYAGGKLTVWLNGVHKRMLTANLVKLSNLKIVGSGELGIVSLYSRDLNRMEIIQHFVDHHVGNFTNDNVLI
jgi:hypothetical protein